MPIFVINPGQSSEAALTWFLGNMFMDRYFITNNFESAIPAGVRPLIGVYDKWHPENGNQRPEKIIPGPADNTKGGSDSAAGKEGNDVPEAQPGSKTIDNPHDGSGTFWAIFLTLFFFAVVFVIIKFYGAKCWERIEQARGGGAGTFDTTGDLYKNGPVYANGPATAGESILPKEKPHSLA